MQFNTCLKISENHSKEKFLTLVFASILMISIGIFSTSISTPMAFATSSNTGILEPLYFDPYDCTGCSFNWQPIVTAKTNHHNVPFFVVANPDNGPGNATTAQESCASHPSFSYTGNRTRDYQNGIGNLTQAGVVVLGYIWSNPSDTSISSIEGNVTIWKSCYPKINGIFLDGFSQTSGYESRYQSITYYIHSHGLTYSIGNPGADTAESYQGTVDNLVIWETTTYPSNGTDGLSGSNYWHLNYPKSNFSLMVQSKSSLPASTWIPSRSPFVNFIFITSDLDYAVIPSYLNNEVGELDLPASVLISVNATNSAGTPISGYFVQVNQSNNEVPSDYTPMTYNATSGWKYLFTPTSFGTCLFDHWKDNSSTNPSRLMTANTTNAAFTAVYKNNGGTCQ
ncbi:MAG: spherulation-specific family 4 protein [Nitrosotalea sp.]